MTKQTDNKITLKPSELVEAIKICVEANEPVFVWGEPGIGKSDIGAQVAQSLNMEYLDIRLSQADPIDSRGLPIIDPATKETVFTKPSFVRTAGSVLINLEELNRAAPSVQNSWLQALRERMLGDYSFGADVRFMACLNYSHSAGTYATSDAINNRGTHLHLAVDIDDWWAWGSDNGLNQFVLAFMRFRSDLLHQADTKALAYPTPRAWAKVANICDRVLAGSVDPKVASALYAGTVGRGPAIEFEAFLSWISKINIDAIFLNPHTADIPAEPAARYAVSAALARRASLTNFDVILQYLHRMPDELAVYAVASATKRDPELQTMPCFTKDAFMKYKHLFA
jgi:hypothetical protein